MARIFVWLGKQLIWRPHGPQPPAQRGWKTHDAMPSRVARNQVTETDELYHELYRHYHRGKLPPWGNQIFERINADIREFYSRNQEGRRPTTPRAKCRKDIAFLHRLGFWPGPCPLCGGNLTDQQWADRLRADLRTYQRAKQDFARCFGGP
jgi:hypothetical protein